MSTRYLRSFRKQTDITQSEIGFIMNLVDYSNISRWEKGLRQPSVEVFLTYHLLFHVPFEPLFKEVKDDLNAALIPRIGLLIHELKQEEQTPKVKSRIAFLTTTLTRLTA